MSSISSVVPGNFEIEGLEEFVVSPEPNIYFVGLKLSPEHAAIMGVTNGKCCFGIRIETDNSAGVFGMWSVDDSNSKDKELFADCDGSPEHPLPADVISVLEWSGQPASDLCAEFVQHHGWDAINADYGIIATSGDGMLELLKKLMS